MLRLPAPLRDHADGRRELELDAPNVAAALQSLVLRHPTLRRHLFADDGQLRGYVNVFRNEELLPADALESAVLRPGDVVSIVPSIAGGAGTAAPGRGYRRR